MAALNIVLWVIGSCFAAEFVGYFVHMLLHSNKFEILSRNHMLHHLRFYGPRMPKRTVEYNYSAAGRFSLFNVGMEWIIPLGAVYGSFGTAFYLLSVSYLYQGVFLVTTLTWAYLMFSYMHDAQHLKNFWMLRAPVLSTWFKHIRRLHDVHHLEIGDDGRMTSNFGICFFGMDRLLGSFKNKIERYNEKGFEAADKLYSYIDKPLS